MYQNVEEILVAIRGCSDLACRRHLARALRRAIVVATAQDMKSSRYFLTTAEVEAGTSIGKLEAVKRYKQRTGRSLMDSKREVEQHFERNGLMFGRPPAY